MKVECPYCHNDTIDTKFCDFCAKPIHEMKKKKQEEDTMIHLTEFGREHHDMGGKW